MTLSSDYLNLLRKVQTIKASKPVGRLLPALHIPAWRHVVPWKDPKLDAEIIDLPISYCT